MYMCIYIYICILDGLPLSACRACGFACLVLLMPHDIIVRIVPHSHIVYVCMYACILTCVYIHIYTYIHMNNSCDT